MLSFLRIKIAVLISALVLVGVGTVAMPEQANAVICLTENGGQELVPPDAVSIGTVSLDANHNTLTIAGATWKPAVGCTLDLHMFHDGSAHAFVQSHTSLATAIDGYTAEGTQASVPTLQFIREPGNDGSLTNGTINVSSLPNGSYTVVFFVDGAGFIPGGGGADQITKPFTINRTVPGQTWTLDVAPVGGNTGNGSVTSTGGSQQINCTITGSAKSGNCSRTYTDSQQITMTATAASGHTFTGWGGACASRGTNATCSLTMNANKSATVSFTENAGGGTRNLSVSKGGDGTGTVTAPADGQGNGISCGADCAGVYGNGASVTLTAAAGGGSVFTGWSGGGCSGTASTCQVTMNQNRAVTATFNTTGVSADLKMRLSSNDAWSNGPLTVENPTGNTGVYIQWLSDSGATCTAASNPENGWWATGNTVGLDANGDGSGYVEVGAGAGAKVFSMTCTRNGQQASDSVTVNVTQAVTPTVNLKMKKSSDVMWSDGPLSGGGTYDIQWTTTNSPTSCISFASPSAGWWGDGVSRNVAGGTVTGQGNWQTRTFYITCSNAAGSANDSVTVNVPLSATLSATPNPVSYGNTTTLNWSSAGATQCVATAGTGAGFGTGGATSGSDASLQIWTSPVQFALQCTNDQGGSAVASTTVKLLPRCLPAGQSASTTQTVTLNASAGNPTPGALYTWSAPGGTPSSGTGSSLNVSYSTPGEYAVTVSADGVTSQACTVTVTGEAPATTGSIRVTSNIATTWSFNPALLAPPPTTDFTYDSVSVGPFGTIYTISPALQVTVGETVYQLENGSFAKLVQAGQLTTYSLVYTPYTPPESEPYIDLKVANSDGPVDVPANQSFGITWVGGGFPEGHSISCSGSGEATWNGAKAYPTGGINHPGIASGATFTIVCDDSDDKTSVSDSVVVGIRLPQCSDEQDNDGDLEIDQNDPGCLSGPGGTYDPNDDNEANAAQCSDGIDNDEDGEIDYPNDPGCQSPDDNDETNQELEVTQCNDGLDNDGDGFIDYPTDPGCESPLDPSELDDPDIREI